MYKIMGRSRGQLEEIDEFDTEEEAVAMLAEYRLAFGSLWELWVSE